MFRTNPSDHFFQEPVPLPELDQWLLERQKSLPRFTFTEQVVLETYWQQGQDIRLREDNRFLPVNFPGEHWQTTQEIVANEKLYDLLLDQDQTSFLLAELLDQFNREKPEPARYIFCPTDERFSLNQEAQGKFMLCLAELSGSSQLSDEQVEALKEISAKLLEKNQMSFTMQFRVELESVIPGESVRILDITPWLLSQPGWARVGKDLWYPRSFLPEQVTPHRYAVRSVSSGRIEQFFQPDDQTSISKVEVGAKSPRTSNSGVIAATGDKSESYYWRITLRTFHLNEGVLPVPLDYRTLYPRARKLVKVVALHGLWFEDGQNFKVWLDTSHHRFFGSELHQHLELLNVGTILEIHWTPNGLTFKLAGEDLAVVGEEARLVDLSGLLGQAPTRLESYRESLREILLDGSKSFVLLYEQLANRQGHQPNRHTVRSVLSSSPEFIYNHSSKEWDFDRAFEKAEGARYLRNAGLLANFNNEPEVSSGNESTEVITPVPSLSEIIATNRQKLAVLRESLRNSSSHIN